MIELVVVPHHTTAGDMNKVFFLRRWTVLKSDWFVLLMKQKDYRLQKSQEYIIL